MKHICMNCKNEFETDDNKWCPECGLFIDGHNIFANTKAEYLIILEAEERFDFSKTRYKKGDGYELEFYNDDGNSTLYTCSGRKVVHEEMKKEGVSGYDPTIIQGLSKLIAVNELNIKAFKDGDGQYRFLIFDYPDVDNRYRDPITDEDVLENVVVDLTKYNKIGTDKDFYEFYDNFMDMYHLGELNEYFDPYKRRRARNGVHLISKEANEIEFKIKLNRDQLEMINEGLYGSTENHITQGFTRDNPEYPNLNGLIKTFMNTRRSISDFDKWFAERKEESI